MPLDRLLWALLGTHTLKLSVFWFPTWKGDPPIIKPITYSYKVEDG